MNIILYRQVFDKAKFNETVDTEFNQLLDKSDLQFFDLNLATVEDFFNLYNKLFYEIPKQGDVNSHQFLAAESAEYVDFLANNAEVQALLDEIAALREQNLALLTDALDEAESSQGTNVIDETS